MYVLLNKVGGDVVTATSVATAWEPRDYLSMAAAVTAILALALGYLFNLRALATAKENADGAIWQKTNEAELAQIQAKLDTFYGPFMQLSGINRLISRDLRDRQRDSETFLLIEKLFDRDWIAGLPDGEKTMLAEIASNAKALREFVSQSAGKVDAKILPYLSRVSAHYRMIELAHEGKLGTDPAPFVQRYVFPAQIDKVLQLEVMRLERRKQALRSNPSNPLPPIEELEIPSDLALREWVHPRRTDRPELNMPANSSATEGRS